MRQPEVQTPEAQKLARGVVYALEGMQASVKVLMQSPGPQHGFRKQVPPAQPHPVPGWVQPVEAAGNHHSSSRTSDHG